MSNVSEVERQTQNHIIKFFKNILNYEYLGNWEKRLEENSNIEKDLLISYLRKQKYSENLITKAIYEINKAANDQNKDLYYVNREVYELLRYGIKVQEEAGKNNQTVWLIDWKNPNNNHFAIAEEVSISGGGKHIKRPDIVIYVNGIALGVLELKRSTVSVTEGIGQNYTNQKKEFIRSFFNTIQLIMAGNNTEGIRYGVIETTEKHYLTWKESNISPEHQQSILEQHIAQLCNKERFLELIHDYIAFDFGTKKICRHNQYYGVKLAQENVRNHQGGIIWHTQGSGKSITMVWLAKWIIENMLNARILIITDRKELDEQIEQIFNGINENIYRCKNGKDLINKLNEATPPLLCSLIHKFNKKEEPDYEGYINNIEQNIVKNFEAKGNVYVFVDECHRTQSGALHKAMKKILPKSMFIGFTGTPLLKKDKQKSIEVFGGYIHTYKYHEAVADGVVLDLRYEARDIDQKITSPEKINLWFNAKTKGLNDSTKIQLKKKWGTMQKVLSSQSRLTKIVSDILLDMEIKDRLSNDRGNAILVTGSIYGACKLYDLFINANFNKCAIVTSYKPSVSDVRTEDSGEGATEKLKQYEIYNKMLDGRTVEDFEKEVKNKFIKEPGQMKLLIVVDKLLTGFDAPPATYLYIDKKMQDHALFQAVCRVNRLDEDKEYGYIVDYKDLFPRLESSVSDYTSGAFEGFDKNDVSDLLSNRLEKAKERLEEAQESIRALCEPVEAPFNTENYIHYFCAKDTSNRDELKNNEPKRIALYKQTSTLVRAFANIANEYDQVGYSKQQFKNIKQEIAKYEDVRKAVKIASGDYINLKLYEPGMRNLLDNYIHADDSVKISAFDDLSIIQLLVKHGINEFIKLLPKNLRKNKEAIAETIENNLRKIITDEQPINPKYYENMSQLLDELIKQRKKQALGYQEYLAKIEELRKQIENPAFSTAYPPNICTPTLRALYDNLNQNQELVIKLDSDICNTKKAIVSRARG